MIMKVNFHYAFIYEHLVSFLSIPEKRGSNFHMHNFPFCQPVSKSGGEFSRDIVYNYTLKNKPGQWFSSHFLVQQNAVF